jgi:hypothetical protein
VLRCKDIHLKRSLLSGSDLSIDSSLAAHRFHLPALETTTPGVVALRESRVWPHAPARNSEITYFRQNTNHSSSSSALTVMVISCQQTGGKQEWSMYVHTWKVISCRLSGLYLPIYQGESVHSSNNCGRGLDPDHIGGDQSTSRPSDSYKLIVLDSKTNPLDKQGLHLASFAPVLYAFEDRRDRRTRKSPPRSHRT